MGAVHNPQEDALARTQMQFLDEGVRAWICHHFGNSLCVWNGNLYHLLEGARAGRLDLAPEVITLLEHAHQAGQHMAEDIDVIRHSGRR